MAQTTVNLMGARPSTISQGDTPLGAYKGVVLDPDIETKDSGQQIIKFRVQIESGTNSEGIGFTPQVTCNLPGPASGDNTKFFADRTAGLYAALGYPPEKVTKDGFTIDTDKHMKGKTIHIYCEPRVSEDAFPRVEYMLEAQYVEFVAGKFKVAPRQPKKDNKGGAKAGSNKAAANDLDDDLPANGKGSTGASHKSTGGSATNDLDL